MICPIVLPYQKTHKNKNIAQYSNQFIPTYDCMQMNQHPWSMLQLASIQDTTESRKTKTNQLISTVG